MKYDRLPENYLNSIIGQALAEDRATEDITSQLLIPETISCGAVLLAKEAGVLAGVNVAKKVFESVDPSVAVEILLEDGQTIKPGNIIATINGRARSILRAERVALNFLQRLCGIATVTAKYVAEVKGLGTEILDTRKTTPGLRLLEKYAVAAGGGYNHRMTIADAVLIKDNHLAALEQNGLTLEQIVAQAKAKAPYGVTVEVEVTSVAQALEALKARPHTIMLDNMATQEMADAVKAIAGRARTEASGGVNLQTVKQIAETGVDCVSVGALTHSVKSLDISLDFNFNPAY
ncbi:carboxylating nicotinate-nucleotide diphosphorylase [Chloroflexota bacterium]